MRKKNHSASIFKEGILQSSKKVFYRIQNRKRYRWNSILANYIREIAAIGLNSIRIVTYRRKIHISCRNFCILDFWNSHDHRKKKKKRNSLSDLTTIATTLAINVPRAMPYFQQLKNSTRCEKMGLASSSRSANLIIILTFQRILWLLLKINIHECVDNRIVDLQRIFHPHFITFNKR